MGSRGDAPGSHRFLTLLPLQGQSGEPGLKGQVSPSPLSLADAILPFLPRTPPSPFALFSPPSQCLLIQRGPMAARSSWRARIPRPQRGCGSPRSAGLPRASRPPRTDGRSRRARTTWETRSSGEWTPGLPDSLGRTSSWECSILPKAGSSQRFSVYFGDWPQIKRMVVTCAPKYWAGCGAWRWTAGAIGFGGRSFFTNRILCTQGRVASDQHIVDVVLKMIQGKGQAATLTHSPLQYLPGHPSLASTCMEGLESLVCIPALPPGNCGTLDRLP